MLRNYWITTWRNLVRNRSYSLINLIGLTLGLGVAIMLFWIVRFEYSFDRYHRNTGRLYQVRSHDKYGEANSHVPQGIIKALQTQFPGVAKAASVKGTGNTVSVKIGQQVVNATGFFYAPPTLADMIDLVWVSGSPKKSLTAPNQVVLDEKTAQDWFGHNALGKTLRLDNVATLTVSGIIRNVKPNSMLPIRVLVSYATLPIVQEMYKNENHWGGGDSKFHGYVLLEPGALPTTIETGLNRLAARHRKESDYISYDLMPLPDAHFDTDIDAFNYTIAGWMVYTLAGIGLLLIGLAGINFINLATVQATKRSREIAVRKVLGSSRSQLISQFFGETALLVFLAIGLGSLLATHLIPFADRLLNTQVGQSTIWNGSTLIFLLSLGTLVTLLAGSYPALVLSGFQPVRVLRGRFSGPRRGISLRQTLVVVQFVIAQVLVICTLLGIKQIRYMYQKDLGFDKKAVVTVDMPEPDNVVLRERFRQQLRQHPEIKDVAFGLTTPSSSHNWWWNTVRHRNLPNGEYTFRFQHVDTNYFQFFKIPLVAGRSWNRADTNTVAIINEKAARDLGFQTPERAIGERINLYYDKPFTILGVVKDYHSQSLRSSIVPHIFLYTDGNFQTASIRIDPQQTSKAIAHIEQYWKGLFPNAYFRPTFLDQDLRAFYDDERKLTNFLTLFAIVGIFIGCLGLFGLVSFVVTQRTKEIGVRKVLGASVAGIVALLSKDFLKLVLIAFIIASPIAYYAMSQFLKDYEYKITIEWWVFALAGLLGVSIALLTVSFQSVKAALMNPVNSLRSD
ncbi:ABC transporter permease [Spirosoma sp.]|uniref:ABC transporter permease n=1 Tax=Spirosoma sp. TaxID=1899569 RepID=UPI00261CCF52|nr:ABC transporter permease [Spirosoma sp.]MCX6213674.1 ABC transporter permease [Spirosoma sp.]